MIHNNDENAFLGSSGIALLFYLIWSVNTTLVIDFVFDQRFNSVIEIMPSSIRWLAMFHSHSGQKK